MRIALLTQNPDLYSSRSLVRAARARGHHIDCVKTLEVTVNTSAHKPELFWGGRALTGYDAVIPRIGASVTLYGLAVLRQFEMMGVFPLNESVAIGRARDKLRALQLMARRGIGMPVTAFAHDPKQAGEVINMVGGPPVVIKLLEGTQGIGVVLGETFQSAKSVIEAFRGVNVNILVQEFISEAGGSDIRALVIGGKVVASIARTGAPGEFRSNIHRGGSATRIRITPEERAIAVQAARTVGLNVCGVDMLRSKRGPLVVEVNSSPGLEGVETATEIDVAAKMIEFLEKHAKPNQTRTRGKG